MKNIILVLFFLSLSVCAQTEKTILSKLIDYSTEKTPAYCGYQIAYGVLKFELQESTEKLNKGDIVFVVQQCPREQMEMVGGEYENNKTYDLFIGNEADKKYTSIGKWQCEKFYPKDKPKKFWYGRIIKKQ